MQLSFIVDNLPSFLLILGAVYFLTLAHRVIKNPLSSVPGPQITKWTDLILKYYTVTGQRPRYVHALHQKYGPIVRISPSTVDISCIRAAREIHRIASPFLKSPWYRLLNRKDGESIFSTTDPEYHRRHRRLLSSPLSEANLRAVEPLVKSRVQLAMARIREEALSPRGVADIYKWFFFMATDIIGELSFGDSFRMLEIGRKNQYIADLETVAKIGGIRATFPFTMSVAAAFPLSVFKEVVASTDRILDYAAQSVDRYESHLALNPDQPKPTLFTNLYATSKVKEGECFSDREIRNDAQSFIVAGSDTTANTLAYLIWSVLKDKKIQERLVTELNALVMELDIEQVKEQGLSDEHLRGLPYMNQVINETLRLYPVVPSGLPRVVPEKGSTLVGHWLPGGTTVTTQLYSLQRDSQIFTDPERSASPSLNVAVAEIDSFDPSRWESPSKAMKDAFMPFGAGSRNCVGLHLARMELRLATAFFFRSFPTARMSMREGMCDGDMDMMLHFLLSPKGKRCLVEVVGPTPRHD